MTQMLETYSGIYLRNRDFTFYQEKDGKHGISWKTHEKSPIFCHFRQMSIGKIVILPMESCGVHLSRLPQIVVLKTMAGRSRKLSGRDHQLRQKFGVLWNPMAPGDKGDPGDLGESQSPSLSSGGGGGGADSLGCTKTRGFGGTIHSGDDRNPARPGKRGTGAACATGSGSGGGGGGAGGAWWGRNIKGAEVKPQGFLAIFMGSTCTKRGGAKVVAGADSLDAASDTAETGCKGGLACKPHDAKFWGPTRIWSYQMLPRHSFVYSNGMNPYLSSWSYIARLLLATGWSVGRFRDYHPESEKQRTVTPSFGKGLWRQMADGSWDEAGAFG
jgi:hypothetical protein